MKIVSITGESEEIGALMEQARDEAVILLDERAGQTQTIPLEEVKRQLGFGD